MTIKFFVSKILMISILFFAFAENEVFLSKLILGSATEPLLISSFEIDQTESQTEESESFDFELDVFEFISVLKLVNVMTLLNVFFYPFLNLTPQDFFPSKTKPPQFV
jgi:hypothetical protein